MKARPDFPGGGAPAPVPAPADPAATLAAARAQFDAWQRQHRRAVMAEELTRALVVGGLSAALAGGFCAAGLCPWAGAAVAGAAGAAAALLVRRPWRRLPASVDTALTLERREGWQNALSTLLLLCPPPKEKTPPAPGGKSLSPAARDFAAWLAPRLPRWRAARLPLRPASLRFLALPPCLLLAEILLGQAAAATPGGAGDMPPGAAPSGRRIVAVLPGANAPKTAPQLPVIAPEDVPADAARVSANDAPRTDPQTGAESAKGAGENDAGAAPGAAALSTAHGAFSADLPALAPDAVLERLENGAANVPLPYRQAVSRYFAAPSARP